DRRNVMQAACIDPCSEGDDPARSFDVHLDLPLLLGGEVVDGGEMEEMADPAAQRFACFVGDAEVLTGQVPLDRHGAPPVDAPECVQRIEPLGRRVAHEKMNDRAAAREQPPDESTTDEAGGSG